MSSPTAPTASVYRWHDGQLEFLDYCDMTDTSIVVADSWLVTDGAALAIGLHKDRFLEQVPAELDGAAFWDAAIAAIPTEGDWFPRVELQDRSGAPLFVFRLRTAPERGRSAVVATWRGDDPRTTPLVKGPDLEAMTRLRTSVQSLGADEAVLLSPEGYVIEGAYSALVWWRGSILCAPSLDLDRVDSVTARSLFGLATALGVDVHFESVTPAELDGTELWLLNALHGPRIVTSWVDGPELAELPGRLTLWRERLARLRHAL